MLLSWWMNGILVWGINGMMLTVKAEGLSGKCVTVSLAIHKPTTGNTLGYYSDARVETPSIEAKSELWVTLLSASGTRTTSVSTHNLLYPYNLLRHVLLFCVEGGGNIAL
jgi:hypothetical protein